jgi:hypothetical protein
MLPICRRPARVLQLCRAAEKGFGTSASRALQGILCGGQQVVCGGESSRTARSSGRCVHPRSPGRVSHASQAYFGCRGGWCLYTGRSRKHAHRCCRSHRSDRGLAILCGGFRHTRARNEEVAVCLTLRRAAALRSSATARCHALRDLSSMSQ